MKKLMLYTVKSILCICRKRAFIYSIIFVVLLGAFLFGGCATNPATGKKTLSLISESQEINMGKQSDKQISASLGTYQDQDLEEYVRELGENLAAKSERPNLPWTFRVLDDPTVNAFALPGGYIYVTRGILTYLNDEAELAGVIGHEIGHVTAKHAVQRISSQQLLQIGLGIGMVISPELQQYGEYIGAGLGVLFLKFSRDDENQADSLGLRYMGRANYDPRQMTQVMAMLDGVSKSEGGGRIPEWLSTHPNPGNRKESIQNQVARMNVNFDETMVNRDRYLEQIDGIIFGYNPREGFFRKNVFYQPDLQFLYVFPEGWKTSNMKQAVIAVSPKEDAIIQITISGEISEEAAADKFFTQKGITVENVKKDKIHGQSVVTGSFSVQTEQGVLGGMVGFISYNGNVYQILGYSSLAVWPAYTKAVEKSIYSFDRLTDQEILSVQPMRIRIVTLERDMTLEEFMRTYPSPVSLDTLALINQVKKDTVLTAGQKVKQVVGEKVQ